MIQFHYRIPPFSVSFASRDFYFLSRAGLRERHTKDLASRNFPFLSLKVDPRLFPLQLLTCLDLFRFERSVVHVGYAPLLATSSSHSRPTQPFLSRVRHIHLTTRSPLGPSAPRLHLLLASRLAGTFLLERARELLANPLLLT